MFEIPKEIVVPFEILCTGNITTAISVLDTVPSLQMDKNSKVTIWSIALNRLPEIYKPLTPMHLWFAKR